MKRDNKGLNTMITLTAIIAVMTTIVGPVLDHHYAERQATHGHLFVHGLESDHVHLSDEDHVHTADEAIPFGVVATIDSEASGVILDNVAPFTLLELHNDDPSLHLTRRLIHEHMPIGVETIPLTRPPIS